MASSDLMITSQADFALNLLRNTDYGNSTVMSIISISIALGMTLLGAKENTAQEIRNTIAKGVDEAEIHQYFSHFLHLTKTDYKDAVKIANKIYFADNFKILDSFKNGIQRFYNGNFEQSNFRDRQLAANIVNTFVANATDNEILNIVNEDTFENDTKMLLINAIMFEKNWKTPFWRSSKKDTFFSTSENKEVFMLDRTIYCRYFKTDSYQFIEIPYEGDSFSMFILLPHERHGLSKVLENLNAEKMLELMSADSGTTEKTQVVIPEFTIEASFDLIDTLEKLNIKDAFDGNANFSGISNSTEVYISKVIHEATIKVTATGTKAAAATAIRATQMCNDWVVETFKADHPFLYFIADKEKNIYFIGTFYG